MLSRYYRYAILCLSILFAFPTFAQDQNTNQGQDFKAYVSEIEQRLDKSAQLYEQHQNDEARTTVQMAYFEIFENLEGPIRINFSAKKSYEMEATFGKIRRMMGDGAPIPEVNAKINQLKNDLNEVLPTLETGHQLSGEASHTVYDQNDIAVHWKQSYKIIDDSLAAMITAYQKGNFRKAKQLAQQAQYKGYKNSEMEQAVRYNRSSKDDSSINQQFYDLIRLSGQPGKINDIAYQTTLLLQDIEELLPNLPTISPEQQVSANDEQNTQTETIPNKDWAQVSASVNQDIQKAIELYKKGEHKKAILSVQDTYFDIFEHSGFEAKIGAKDNNFKAQLEGYFTRIVSLMNAGKDVASIQEQAKNLSDNLAKAVSMIQTTGTGFWAIFIMSLTIILREGLEALLIVAAIVAYLVKNNHKDKLHVISNSVYVALGASVVTAIIFQLIFSNAGASRELLEGFTMIFAVIMLFMMSYWLLSKVEANNWKHYLEGKLSTALTTGSLIGLWLTSFLAVYREGAETVLFYYAILADVQSTIGYLYALGGFAVGVIILAICYFVMRYTVVKLPLKPFFVVTGAFMYIMAFIFAGTSVKELIEGKLFLPTLISGFPEITWLGIYPYYETLIPQVFLILAAIFALFYMKRQSKHTA